MRGAAPPSPSFRTCRIPVAVVIAVLFLCLFVYLYLDGLFLFYSSSSLRDATAGIKSSEGCSVSCESSERVNMLKSELVSMSEKNARLEKQVRDLSSGDRRKAGPFGTVRGLRTNPTVLPDESVNPRLAKILEKLAVHNELIVALANSHIKDLLEIWIESIKRVGIPNYLVVALDDDIENFCKSKDVPVYRRNPDVDIDNIGKTGTTVAVSGLKFLVLREFLQLGYSVLLSDVDVVYLRNPFDHLYRDSDIESMTDGFNNKTAYGYINVFDDPSMGWSSLVYTMRIWVYNSGFFYIRPTISSIELLDRVTKRISVYPKAWDQQVFNELLFYPSHPGYVGLHASRRTMDIYLFMNSYVLFKHVRKDSKLRKLKPVVIHVNYHPDKLPRMKAVVDFYVNGKQNALDPFTDGTPK
ncbi:hypothetical protein J5N97_010445 [Dioscorea zingiberensis]|uniref:Glycosyltransferase n=1 Tax=Dioscorea zingiberensis TaxID=325984 RepID=A0A9D5CYF0_9LILI|nr:hypothetical protein J5N97_010445 [Dioscorea zingiberensis]